MPGPFKFSGQHGLGGGPGTHINDKVLNIDLTSYCVSPLHIQFTLNVGHSSKWEQAWNSIKHGIALLQIIRGLHLSSL